MIKIKIKKKGKKLLSIKQAVAKLDGQSTQLGYFQSQGKHKGGMNQAREYSYVGLAQALELGYFPVQQIVRTPMPFMNNIGDLVFKGISRSVKIRRAFKAWGKKLDKKGNPQKLLNAVGEYGVMQSKKVFNNPAYFPQASSNATPLWETGDFAKNFTYRTTFDNRVRKV